MLKKKKKHEFSNSNYVSLEQQEKTKLEFQKHVLLLIILTQKKATLEFGYIDRCIGGRYHWYETKGDQTDCSHNPLGLT